LPENGFVFCCFNQSRKITPEIFEVWCRLLSPTPDSVLWLMADRMAEGNLKNLAMQHGVLPSRLVFAEPLPQDDHLARLQLADLLLDTLPYNAHTTASDALWAGVPLVTCSGDTFASRVAGSLLHAVGLPELITEDLEEYFELALVLSQAPERYECLVSRLEANRLTTPLFDIKRYTQHLEDLYRQMWGRYQSGDIPNTLDTEAMEQDGRLKDSSAQLDE
jgi:predicted O-linked N-acetylglucosamine transferase (SPINDLY family)